MLLAGIQKRFLDTGLEPAGMTNGNSNTYSCGAVLSKRAFTIVMPLPREIRLHAQSSLICYTPFFRF